MAMASRMITPFKKSLLCKMASLVELASVPLNASPKILVIGILKYWANLKSLSSPQGTAIIAPVPYPANTYSEIQIGIFTALKGLIA